MTDRNQSTYPSGAPRGALTSFGGWSSREFEQLPNKDDGEQMKPHEFWLERAEDLGGIIEADLFGHQFKVIPVSSDDLYNPPIYGNLQRLGGLEIGGQIFVIQNNRGVDLPKKKSAFLMQEIGLLIHLQPGGYDDGIRHLIAAREEIGLLLKNPEQLEEVAKHRIGEWRDNNHRRMGRPIVQPYFRDILQSVYSILNEKGPVAVMKQFHQELMEQYPSSEFPTDCICKP
jgi:hypothetical protein